jgi:hypothetical protein
VPPRLDTFAPTIYAKASVFEDGFGAQKVAEKIVPLFLYSKN